MIWGIPITKPSWIGYTELIKNPAKVLLYNTERMPFTAFCHALLLEVTTCERHDAGFAENDEYYDLYPSETILRKWKGFVFLCQLKNKKNMV